MALAQSRERLRLIRADRLEQVTQGNRVFKKLTGDVLFEKGELRLACDWAYWFEDVQRADFYGHVVATKQTKRLTADTLTYYSNEEVLIARGKPQLTDDSLLIRARRLSYRVKDDEAQAWQEVWLNDSKRMVTADRLTYFAPLKKSIALGRALIDDPKQRTSLTADSLIYFNQTGLIEATLSPVLTRYDTSGAAEFKIKGKRIVLDEKAGNFQALQQVTIWREDFTATGEKLTYTDSLESALLEENPRVISDKQEITGKLMAMQFRNEQLAALFIYEDAKALARGKAYLPADSAGQAPTDTIPTLDEITGRNMAIYFAGGRTDSIRVFPMAASRYHILEDSVIIGTNEVSGDTVIMNFANNKLARIRVTGGTEGRFIPHPTNRDLDTTVVYSSEFIDYDVQNKKTYLIQTASMRMGDTQLTAGQIYIEWNNNLLYANPLTSADEDSSAANVPTLYQRGREPFAGDNMVYNLKTQRGRIVQGKTKEQDGYYYGQHISKVGQKVFYVTDGIYTTCDQPTKPHFYFRSRRMKIIFRDKVIARPIVLFIHDIPILALPFGVFPNKGGRRHSGWIMPTWIENKNIGGSLQGFGYFWAPNDYLDLRLTGDFYDKKGICLHSRMRYARRYHFDGSISGSYYDQFLMNIPSRKWTLNINHSQTISPTMHLSVDGRFVSDEELYRKFRYDREDRLNQYLISNATLRKSWPGKPYALSVNLNQEINLQAQVARRTPPSGLNQSFNYITRSLPNIAFSRSSKPLIPSKSSGQASRWYNNIYFSINSRVNNRQNIYYQSYQVDDTTFAWDEINQTRSAVTHNITLNGAQKLFKVISLNPSLSIDEGWVFAYEEPLLDEQGRFVIDAKRNIVTRQVAGFRARHTGSASLNAQTKLYGLFPIRIGPLQGFRHVLTPGIGLSYRPDFTKSIWGWQPGYVQTGYDSLGNYRIFDPFKNTLLGSTPSGEYRALNFNLSNLFQMKTMHAGNPQKTDLFNLNISGSYNFAADSLRWSLISTSFRTQVTKKVAINVSATHDLYKLANGTRINQWHKTYYGVPIPRLTNISASTGFALSGKRFSGTGTVPSSEAAATDTLVNTIINPSYSNTINERAPVMAPSNVGGELWSASFNFRYNLAFNSAGKQQASCWMGTSLKVNLTDKWRLTYAANFDLLQKKLVSQDFRIERNLHCWQFVFTWTPSGYGQQYTLLINILSTTLQDIKYEERGGMRRGIGW